MKLLIVRHAIAEDKETFARTGQDDASRPLTEEGRKKMKRTSRGLRSIVPELKRIATSPWLRAVQTAEIVASAYDAPAPAEAAPLAGDCDPDETLRWLREQEFDLLAVVGHEPHLGQLVGRLVGVDRSPLELKKGAACLLDLGAEARAGDATLMWALQPGQLRKLAR